MQAADKVAAAGLHDLAQHLGIAQCEIRRRQHVQALPDREIRDRRILPRHAADIGGGRLPPSLGQQECLRQHVEGRQFPIPLRKPPVIRGRRNQAPGAIDRMRVRERLEKLHRVMDRIPCQRKLLARRDGQMELPIELRQRKRGGRQPAGPAGDRGMGEVIDHVERRYRLVRRSCRRYRRAGLI